jgi:hypothetical protein
MGLPAFLDELSWSIAEMYAETTDAILVNLARYFPIIHSSKQAKDAFEYQAQMLARMGQVDRETIQVIAYHLGGADEKLREAISAAIMESLKYDEPQLRKAAAEGILEPPLVPEVDPEMMQTFRYLYKQSADKLNIVNTRMLESTRQAYIGTVSDITQRIANTQAYLNIAAGNVGAGVESWNTAVTSAVEKMVRNGITGFVDSADRNWSPEAYVAMDVRTTTFNAAREAVWERAADYGNDLYQVSSHNGARPLCYPWQCKVISREDRARDVTDFDGNTVHVYAQSETSYGEAAGLFGINCRHYPQTFIPGISAVKEVPQDEEENERTYKESQEQRRLEREMRYARRDVAVAKAQGADAKAIDKLQDKADRAEDKLQSFVDQTGRHRRKSREYELNPNT